MPLPKKDEQIEALFNPQTVNDREAVTILCCVGRLADEHKGDRKYAKLIIHLSASAIALSRIDGNIDQQVFGPQARAIVDEYWKELDHGDTSTGS